MPKNELAQVETSETRLHFRTRSAKEKSLALYIEAPKIVEFMFWNIFSFSTE